jgi:hypothetical protein
MLPRSLEKNRALFVRFLPRLGKAVEAAEVRLALER